MTCASRKSSNAVREAVQRVRARVGVRYRLPLGAASAIAAMTARATTECDRPDLTAAGKARRLRLRRGGRDAGIHSSPGDGAVRLVSREVRPGARECLWSHKARSRPPGSCLAANRFVLAAGGREEGVSLELMRKASRPRCGNRSLVSARCGRATARRLGVACVCLRGTTERSRSTHRRGGPRRRLNRCGDRTANQAPWRIVVVRMVSDRRTRTYVERRTREGRSKREIIRSLKRYAARQLYRHLPGD